MPTFEIDVDIDAPIEYVFDWATDTENQERCSPGYLEIEVLDETEEGLRVRNTMKVLGQTITSEEHYKIDRENWTTTSVFDDGKMSGEMVFHFTEADTGTSVRVEGDVTFGASLFDRVVQSVASRYMMRQFRNTLKTMKELIEIEYAEHEDGANGGS